MVVGKEIRYLGGKCYLEFKIIYKKKKRRFWGGLYGLGFYKV